MKPPDPVQSDPTPKPFDYASPPKRPRAAWIKLPKEDYRLRALLPMYVCCQCMAEGNTRTADDFPVPLCPTCRLAWRRRRRIVRSACVAAIVITVIFGTVLVATHLSRQARWTDLGMAASGITAFAIILVCPVLFLFESPLIIIAGRGDKPMLVRFPNEQYARLINYKAE